MPKEEENTAHEEVIESEDVKEEVNEDVNEAGQSDGEVKDGISELLEIMAEGSPNKAEEESTEEEEQAPEEEEETEEPEDEEEEETQEEEGEPEKEESEDELEEEEESKEEEPPKEESSDELVNRLRGEINSLSRQLMSQPAPTPVPKEPGKEPESSDAITTVGESAAVVAVDITQEEYDEAMTDKDKFSKLVDRVVEVKTQQALESVTQSVNGVVAEKLSLNQRVNDFFDEHENLRGQRDYVGFLAQELADEHHNKSKDPWDMDRIFKELPDLAQKRLGLSAGSTTTNRDNGSKSKSKRKVKSKNQRPAFTKGSRTRASADNLSKEQKDISQTLEL